MSDNGKAPSESARLEQRGLTFSVVGALGMAALGFVFAAITDSDAVLLDGIFSLIGFAVGLIALRVAALVARPDDEYFNLMLVALSLPIPFGIIRANWGQLLGKAPDPLTREIAQELVDEALADWPGLKTRIRLLEQGRFVYLHVYVIGEPEAGLSIADADRMREAIGQRVDAIEHMVGYDVIFTQDMKWVDRTAGAPGPAAVESASD